MDNWSELCRQEGIEPVHYFWQIQQTAFYVPNLWLRCLQTVSGDEPPFTNTGTDLSTDSYINALRRFLARRGNVKLVRSDNGTNFTAANKELKEAINNWNKKTFEGWLHQRNIE